MPERMLKTDDLPLQWIERHNKGESWVEIAKTTPFPVRYVREAAYRAAQTHKVYLRRECRPVLGKRDANEKELKPCKRCGTLTKLSKFEWWCTDCRKIINDLANSL